ncbi:biosynthetic-type acetolactate synthase large subunit [candidate division WOR-3 bacterium]|nr:biosynthetic-type acetolactate synthase large subunit [candidate division WOR-3 bacterium]
MKKDKAEKKKLSGAEILIKSLKGNGAKVIFGYPGGAVLDVFNHMHDSDLEFYLTRHEQGAVHAADGYARASGKCGVCIATSGPGATNLVTGIATAQMDSIPLIAITGQVATSLIGNEAFQEVDATGISRAITKHNYLVKDVNNLAQIIDEAFYIATTGRPGPVLIDIPKDVQQYKSSVIKSKGVNIPGYKPTLMGNLKQIKSAAELIEKAKRPVIYAGGGVITSDASDLLRKLAEKINTPVTTTLLGLGSFPETHELSLGMLGMHGTQYANYAIMESDVILAIGARFDDRVTGKISEFAPHAKIIHIDIDPASVGKNVRVDIPIVGDAKLILKELDRYLKAKKHTDWIKEINGWKEKFPLIYRKKKDFVSPQYVIECVHEITKGKAIIATEVGQNQMWVAQYYKFDKPRTLLSSGGLGTMGYGFPAAIGAKVARPDMPVFDIAGDGSIQMNIQEMATAVIKNIGVKIIILNNGFLGMVRQWQELFYNKRYAATCLRTGALNPEKDKKYKDCPEYTPDFVKLAEAYGAAGIRITKNEDVKNAIKKALEIDGPVIIDCIIDKEENVFPMVPAGASLRQMMGGMA